MKCALLPVIGAASLLAACAANSAAPPQPVAAAAVPGAPASAVVAASPAPVSESCFRTADIVSHQIGSDRTLYIRTRNNRIWKIEMSGACLAAASSDDPLLIREPPGVPYVCRAVDLDISIRKGGNAPGGGIDTPCIPDSVTKLSAAEIDALSTRERP
jgi:hypothetical protein